MKTLLLTLFVFLGLFTAVKAQDINKADSLFNAKDYSKAFTEYRRIDEDGSADAKVYRRMGFCLSQSENRSLDAEQYFKKALKIDSTDLASNYLLAKTIVDNNDNINNKVDRGARLEIAIKCLKYTAEHNYEDSKTFLAKVEKISNFWYK